MANLFEINKAIMDAWDACIDPETGEILSSSRENQTPMESCNFIYFSLSVNPFDYLIRR